MKKLPEQVVRNKARASARAALFPNVTVRKRVGVVLEYLGISPSILRPLAKSVENTALSSLTGSRRGGINKKWRVIVDASQK